MTPRDRLLRFLRGEPTDVRPALPITMMWAADRAGVAYLEYATRAELMAAAQLKVAREFGADHVSVISDPATEAADCGATIFYPPDGPPAIDESCALLADPARLETLRRPDPRWPGSRMANRIEAVRQLKEGAAGEFAVEGWVEGPCAEAADLRGINALMMDFYDDPDFVRRLFDFVVAMELPYAAAQVEAGADFIGIGDAAASLVSRELYDAFVWPAEQRLIAGIHALGVPVRLHICGHTSHLLDALGRLGADILDLDAPVDLARARSAVGPDQVIAGNIHPVQLMKLGTPARITAALDACAAAAGARWVIGAGCEIPRGTPIENVRALTGYGGRTLPSG